MKQPVIQTYGLCKTYKKAEVLHDFNVTVECGHICGLIGPNGAGKTTIIKILAGLIAPSKGDMAFFGNGDNLDENRRRMSFMIEAPMILLGMTARENLAYIRYLRGYPDEKRIDEVLELVGLSDTGDKKASKFSFHGRGSHIGASASPSGQNSNVASAADETHFAFSFSTSPTKSSARSRTFA